MKQPAVQGGVRSNGDQQEERGMRNVPVQALISSISFSNNGIRISKKCPNEFVPLRDLF